MYDYVKDFAGPLATILQTVVIFYGARVALQTIKSNSDIAKKRATLDLITQVLQSDEFRSNLATVNAMIGAQEDSGALSTRMRSESERDGVKPKIHAARYVLNKFSIMAIGIRNEALDEQSFKEYYYSTFVMVADHLQGYMLSIRADASTRIKSRSQVSNETVYEEILWLLERWKKAPLKLKQQA